MDDAPADAGSIRLPDTFGLGKDQPAGGARELNPAMVAGATERA